MTRRSLRTGVRSLVVSRARQRGQGGFALMAGLTIWVGVCGLTMAALLTMTSSSARIASVQAETAAQIRAVDAALETAVNQIRMDPGARIGAATKAGDGSCVRDVGPAKGGGLIYDGGDDISVTVNATCEAPLGSTSRLRDADMAAEPAEGTNDEVAEPAERSAGTRSSAKDDAAGLMAAGAVRTVRLDAVATMPDGQQRSAGSALVVVSDVRGSGTSVSILDWDLTPERPYVPTTTTTVEPTTTTSTTTTVKPTTTTSTTTTVKPTTTTSTTTTVKPTTTTTTVKPTTTTVPAGPSPATWTVRVTSDWTEGYCAEFTVTNPTSSSLTWIVDVPIEGQITSFWNGEYTRSGNTLRVRGASWNHTIAAGSTTGFGLCSNR